MGQGEYVIICYIYTYFQVVVLKFLHRAATYMSQPRITCSHCSRLFLQLASTINQSINQSFYFPHNITLHTSNNNNGPILQSFYLNLFLYFFIELYKYIDVQKVEQ